MIPGLDAWLLLPDDEFVAALPQLGDWLEERGDDFSTPLRGFRVISAYRPRRLWKQYKAVRIAKTGREMHTWHVTEKYASVELARFVRRRLGCRPCKACARTGSQLHQEPTGYCSFRPCPDCSGRGWLLPQEAAQ